jgi:hypothetical protein
MAPQLRRQMQTGMALMCRCLRHQKVHRPPLQHQSRHVSGCETPGNGNDYLLLTPPQFRLPPRRPQTRLRPLCGSRQDGFRPSQLLSSCLLLRCNFLFLGVLTLQWTNITMDNEAGRQADGQTNGPTDTSKGRYQACHFCACSDTCKKSMHACDSD